MLLKKHFLRFISCVDHLLYRLIVFVCLCVEFMRSLTGGMMNRSLRTHTDGSVHGSVGHQTWTATPKFRVKLIINSWITRKTDLDHRVRSKFMIQLSLAVWSNFTCSAWTKWLGWPACKWPHSLCPRLEEETWTCNYCVFFGSSLKLSYPQSRRTGTRFRLYQMTSRRCAVSG